MAEKTAPITAEELKNCGACKKPVQKAKRYYRNGRYYCNQNCWNKTRQKKEEA